MSSAAADGGPACAWCSDQPARRQGRLDLCERHYRHQQMRTNAKRHGKAVPSYGDLATMTPRGMICVGCSRAMVWLAVENQSAVATLQHDRSGAMRMLCRSCNTRHASYPGDTFYSVGDTHKCCRACSRMLQRGAFAVDRSRACGLKGRCRECSSRDHREWRKRSASTR